MARNFSASGDVIVTGLTSDPSARSYFLWSYRTGDGGIGFGYMINQGLADDSDRMGFYNDSGANTYNFSVRWNHVAIYWTIARPSLNAWHSLGISYDSSSTSNAAIIYLDGSKPSVTQIGTPTAPYSSVSGNTFKIGNRPAGDTFWQGRIADVACWDVILTDNEFFALCAGARPYNIRPSRFLGYWPLDGLTSPEPDLSGLKNNGTLTGTAFANDPPVTLFTPKPPMFPLTIPPTVLAMHQINAHFTRRITTVGY